LNSERQIETKFNETRISNLTTYSKLNLSHFHFLEIKNSKDAIIEISIINSNQISQKNGNMFSLSRQFYEKCQETKFSLLTKLNSSRDANVMEIDETTLYFFPENFDDAKCR
jgi:hypothetical protein